MIIYLISGNSSIYVWLILKGICSALIYVEHNIISTEFLKYFSFSTQLQVDSISKIKYYVLYVKIVLPLRYYIKIIY
jgi:hypothetical protein